MANEIGDALAQGPQQGGGDNVSKWKDFLTRPENIATALVLAAGVTSERRPDQSRVNKALESGVGALGFRGGLESGIQDQRRETREEQRAAEAQAATIAAQRAETGQRGQQVQQGRRRNEILSQQVEQQGQARPLNPSERDQNLAQAELSRAQAGALDRQFEAQPFIQQELVRELQRASEFGEQPDVAGAIRRGMAIDFIMKKHQTGQVDANGMIKLTSEEAKRMQELTGMEIPEEPEGGGGRGTRPQPRRGETPEKDLRRTGRVISSLLMGEGGEQLTAINTMKQVPGFDQLDDNTILDRVEQARQLAQEKEDLERLSVEQLEGTLETYERVMSPTEARNVRQTLNKKKGVPQNFFESGFP